MSPDGGGGRSRRGPGWWVRFRELPNESPQKVAIVAASVCLVCSLVVSTAAVLLRPLQLENRERERKQHILAIVRALPGIAELFAGVDTDALEARVVELATGDYASGFEPGTYDQREAAADPDRSIPLAPERDLAKLRRRAKYATIYLVRQEGRVELVILPVHGSGYASTMYGYVALAGDANTIQGLSFYEHAETPGLGADIEDAPWLRRWRGKQVRDGAGRLAIRVVKGTAPPAALHEVDGLSGATRTGDGVTNLLHFWLGEDGFGPYLERIRQQGG